MTGKLTAPLRETPATVPALVAVALLVAWASDQAGYPVTHWAPGALIVLALLCIALAVVRLRPADVPISVRVALAALAAYTAFSYLSILWAGVPGDAWEGANRTLLYLAVFALFAGWRQRGVTAALLLVVWVMAMIVLAAITAVHLDAAGGAGLQSMVPGGRLDYPSGYPNANAAQWLMAFWPALLLARSERLPWALRGLLAGGAVLLAEVALLSQSRGSLYATPVMVVLVFALLPGRVRTFALLAPVVAGIGAAAPLVLRVGDRLQGGNATHVAMHGATVAMFVAAVAVALVVALGAAAELRLESGALRQRLDRAIAGVAVATVLVGVVGGLALAGNPVTRLESAWNSFKGGYGQSASTGSRLVSGLGSNRYDFYRVALDEFLAHPIAGIGVDNFQQQYLLHGRSTETPRYPHSVELRTLAETGLIGALLALLGLAGALYATARAVRSSSDPLARAVAAAAAAGFAYWAVQGSFDWFWEFAGLGAPAFAMLGLSCALAPVSRTTISRSKNPAFKRVGLAAAAGCALAASASLAAPWLSQLQIQSAARIWTKAPQAAYKRLAQSADLNPLSDQAYLVAGDIALRFGDLARAEREFSLALKRSPDDAYATLEQGAIASSRGERNTATALLERAVRLSPRDRLAQETLHVVREGRRVDVADLNREILLKAQQFA